MYLYKSFLYALPMLVVFIISHIVGEYTNLYENYAITDIIFHTIGGVVTANLGWNFLNYLIKQGDVPKLPLWFAFMVIVLFTYFIGVVWEWYELGKDYYYMTNYQNSLYDLLADLFFDFTGSVIYLFIVKIRNK